MDNYNIKIYLNMVLSNQIRFWSKGDQAVSIHLLLLFKAWWVITCVACITGALWAKQGECGILHRRSAKREMRVGEK